MFLMFQFGLKDNLYHPPFLNLIPRRVGVHRSHSKFSPRFPNELILPMHLLLYIQLSCRLIQASNVEYQCKNVLNLRFNLC